MRSELEGNTYLRADMLDEEFNGFFKIVDVGKKQFNKKDGSVDDKYFVLGAVMNDEGKVVVFDGESLDKCEFILNQTNIRRIVDYYGYDTDAWINKEIPIRTEYVLFKNEDVLGIRVKPKKKTEDG